MRSNTKKKLAFFGIKGLPSKGGAERVVEAIVNNLSKEYDIYVYCSHSYSKDYKGKNIKLIRLRNLKGKHLFSLSLSLLSTIHALLFKNYDLVHVHNTDVGYIIPLLRLKYKVIATSHGFPYKREKWNKLTKKLLKISENIFFQFSSFTTCVSKTITKEINNKYKRNTQFIPNGIDKPNYLEDSLIFKKYELKKNDYICFAAGRIDPTKGCHILLEAIKNIDNKINVIVIGDFSHKPDYTQKLYQMADEKVTFIPFIENKETLFGIIKNAKLFIFPSSVEAMSIMLLEVAALGLPIVCSDIPENVSVMEGNTIYFKSEDDKELTEKIEFCLNNYEEILKKTEKTKKWVLKKYKWKSICDEYKEIYDSFISSH